MNFAYPVVAAIKDASADFTAAWVEQDTGSGNNQVKARVINDATGTPGAVGVVVNPTTEEIYGLSMEGLTFPTYMGRTILFYTDTISGSPNLNYRILTGNSTSGPTLVSDSVSLNQTTVSSDIVTGNKLLVAWLDPAVDTGSYNIQGVSFKVLNESGGAINQTVGKSLYSPNLVNADYISVTSDKDGYAVFMWTDAFTYRYSFYAYVNPNLPLAPLTDATLIQILPSGSTISLSYNGQGLASYVGRYTEFLPVVRK